MANPRVPKNRKIIRGTFRKDRNPTAEPDPERIVELPRPPSHLGKYGKNAWKNLCLKLHSVGLLTELDLMALEILCEAYDQYREARDAVFVTLDSNGRKRRRLLGEYLAGRNSQTMPEYNVMRAQYTTIVKLLTEFGMTPAARNRIDLANGDESVDPMEKLIDEA